MEKLARYNQRLLAVAGTLFIVGIVFFIMFITIEASSRWFRRQHASTTRDGIVLDRAQVIDTAQYSFRQEISLLEPYQPDSAKPMFIVPIGQVDQKSSRRLTARGGMDYEILSDDNYYYYDFTGLFNNFIIIDYERNIKVPVFKTKVAVTKWAYTKVGSAKLVLFKGTDTDTNQDGKLNSDDFQSLFVYHINSRKLQELSFHDQTVLSFEPLSKTNKIYLRTGKDLDNNKKFETGNEPTDLYFYNVSTGETEALVPDNIKKEVQDILSE